MPETQEEANPKVDLFLSPRMPETQEEANPKVDLFCCAVDLVHLCSRNSSTPVDWDEKVSGSGLSGGREAAHAPRRWSRLSSSARAAVVVRYEAGETSTSLAAEFGVAKSTILGILRDANVVMRRQPLTSEQVDRARELYESGLSLSQVAAQLTLKQDTIRLALKAASVRLRPATGR
ncbi:DNA-directed RNA polymerase specialized sigma24 family protein [Microbacterium sp. SORGH_AS428]|uniref:hypothetical protein n=1 Tax=Microbacterium sp. SORGH_AS_0428 TaxID=3041788 RepID=UPI00286127BC|nr:hypothetical protein [Microbacterium sp. SORGH_AS_0428]MDR6200725.1 DNA-directed RNA polymerase specialized sigma24 family protein [Microbacterium sp. SORGH_AS_0428]